mgnify:CR=1 FL=1
MEFLNDKYARINVIEETIQEIIGILESQPSIQELKTTSLEKLRGLFEDQGLTTQLRYSRL